MCIILTPNVRVNTNVFILQTVLPFPHNLVCNQQKNLLPNWFFSFWTCKERRLDRLQFKVDV